MGAGDTLQEFLAVRTAELPVEIPRQTLCRLRFRRAAPARRSDPSRALANTTASADILCLFCCSRCATGKLLRYQLFQPDQRMKWPRRGGSYDRNLRFVIGLPSTGAQLPRARAGLSQSRSDISLRLVSVPMGGSCPHHAIAQGWRTISAFRWSMGYLTSADEVLAMDPASFQSPSCTFLV